MPKNLFVSIVGRPNVGKSSLLNRLLGEKIAIVSDKPQTTRNRITGVLTEGETQYVLIDTPVSYTHLHPNDEEPNMRSPTAMTTKAGPALTEQHSRREASCASKRPASVKERTACAPVGYPPIIEARSTGADASGRLRKRVIGRKGRASSSPAPERARKAESAINGNSDGRSRSIQSSPPVIVPRITS